jgi:hypothetical protein
MLEVSPSTVHLIAAVTAAKAIVVVGEKARSRRGPTFKKTSTSAITCSDQGTLASGEVI